MRLKTLFIARSAVIAGLYVVLTLVVYPFAYGAIQFRISEALAILPLFFLEAIPGLVIGCLIANIFSGYALDIILGTFATLLAVVATRLCKKIYFGIIPPIVINALIVPIIIVLSGAGWESYIPFMLSIGLSQAIAVGGLGTGLYFLLRPAVKKLDVLRPITFKDLRNKPCQETQEKTKEKTEEKTFDTTAQ